MALCCAKVCRESKPSSKPQTVLTQRENWGAGGPFWEAVAGPVLSLCPLTWGRTIGSPPSPLCSVKGSGTRKTQGAQGSGTVGVSKFSPNGDWSSVCRSHLDVKVSPVPPPQWFGRQTTSTWRGSYLARE